MKIVFVCHSRPPVEDEHEDDDEKDFHSNP